MKNQIIKMSALPPTSFRPRQNTDEVAESGQESELAIAGFISRRLASIIKYIFLCYFTFHGFLIPVILFLDLEFGVVPVLCVSVCLCILIYFRVKILLGKAFTS